MGILFAIWMTGIGLAGIAFGVDVQVKYAKDVKEGLQPPVLVLSVPENDYRYLESVERRKVFFETHKLVDGKWVVKS